MDRKFRRASLLMFMLSFSLILSPIRAEALTVLKEALVSTQGWNQTNHTVAMTPNGNSVIIWVVDGTDGYHDVYARRYDADGRALGREFKVNSDVSVHQYNPFVAIAADGNFVIGWDRQGYGIYARRFSSDATPIGSEFFVGVGAGSSGAMAGDLSFIIVYQNESGIYGLSYSPDGQPIGTEFKVDSYGSGSGAAAIAMNSTGLSVACWQGDWTEWNIYAQRYASDGVPLGTQFQANTYTPGFQFHPSVAISFDGSFIVVWESVNQDGSDGGIFAQRYGADGSPIGSEFQVNTYTYTQQILPSVAMAEDGAFTVAWSSYGQDGSYLGIYAQRYAADGTPIGPEFQVNEKDTLQNQDRPSVAMASNGSFVISWTGSGQSGPKGIYAKFYKQFYTP